MVPDGSRWFLTCSHRFMLKPTKVTNGYHWIHATAQFRFQRHQFLLCSRNFNGFVCPRSRASRAYKNIPMVMLRCGTLCLGYPPHRTLHTLGSRDTILKFIQFLSTESCAGKTIADRLRPSTNRLIEVPPLPNKF